MRISSLRLSLQLLLLLILASPGLMMAQRVLLQTDFNTDVSGWKQAPSNTGNDWWWWPDAGTNGTGALRTKNLYTDSGLLMYVATPALSLTGNTTYRISLQTKAGGTNARTLSLAYSRQPVRDGQQTIFHTTPVLSTSFTEATATFSVPTDGPWYVVAFTNQVAGSGRYVFVHLDDVRIEETNVAPTVTLTTPSAAASYVQGETATLIATAADANGTVSKVEFFANDIKIGEDIQAPYSINWPTASVGTFQLTVRATDNAGAATTSAAVPTTITAYAPGANGVVSWNLNTDANGWAFSKVDIHDWAWYADQGVDGTGGLRLKLASPGPGGLNQYAASPSVALQAGTTYTVNLSARTAQGPNSRTLKVAYSSQQNRLGTVTEIATIRLPGNDYAVPPFLPYAPSFQVPANGNYHLLFYIVETNYVFTYLDEVSVERTLPPTVSLSAPTADARFNEGQDIPVAVTATDPDGSVAKVEIITNGTSLTTLTAAPYTYTWKGALPGDYALTARATDNRGNITLSSAVSMRVNFADGTLAPYLNWNFDGGIDYWASATEYKWWKSGGRNNSAFVEAFSVGGPTNFLASPGVQLYAGETYTFSCRTQARNPNVPFRFSVNTKQQAGGTPFLTITPALNNYYATPYSGTFTVPTDGVYHISMSHLGTGSYQQVSFDDWRIVGRHNQAPLMRLTTPSAHFVTAERSTFSVGYTAIDTDGQIVRTELYANDAKVGESNTAPYSVRFGGLAPGIYQLRAKGYDAGGASDFSDPISVTVLANDLTASYLGGSGTDDVRGMVIQPNGTVVLAINAANGYQPIGITPKLLNAASTTSGGAIVRLSGDGRQVLSMTRVAAQLTDLSQDERGNLYVAAGSDGLLNLNPTADTLRWKQVPGQFAHRVDAGKSGFAVLMIADDTDPDRPTISGNVKLMIYRPDGTLLFQKGAVSQYTTDVAIDETTQTVVGIGHKNFNTSDGVIAGTLPVYVPVVRGWGFDGSVKYVGYDWSSDQTSPRWLNKANNNMADVRAVRCAIGLDDKLYITYEVYGGNHILRYDPFDNTRLAPIVGGDIWFNFSNTNTETKSFVGRYEPGTGAWLLGQGFTARINPPRNSGNTVFSRNGNVTADETGRVYMTGQSAYGIPLTVDHQPGDYVGGAYVLILSPDMSKREAVIRLTHGTGRAVAVRSATNWGYAGSTTNALYTANALQSTIGGGTDGFFVVRGLASAARKAAPLAVTETTPRPTVLITPNPVSGNTLRLQLAGLSGPYSLQIVDAAGRTVLTNAGNIPADGELTVRHSFMANTLYSLRLSAGDFVGTARFVVQP